MIAESFPPLRAERPGEIPVEAIQRWMDKCRTDREAESTAIRMLRKALSDIDKAVPECWYLIAILGETQCSRAVPTLLECFVGTDKDRLYELAEWALVKIGAPATGAVMKWIETEPAWQVRTYGYSFLENAADYADEDMRDDIIVFLMRRVEVEEKIDFPDDLLASTLAALAHFDGEEVVEFVREAVFRYEFNSDMNEALEIAERRFSYPPERIRTISWETMLRKIAGDTERAQSDEDWEELSEQARKWFDAQDWEKAEAAYQKISVLLGHHWEGPEYLAQIYQRMGRIEDAKNQIREALQRIRIDWRRHPEYLDYEVVERLEALGDEILENPPDVPLARWRHYLYGLLVELGAMPYSDAVAYICLLVPMPNGVSAESLLGSLADDRRLQVKDGILALRSITMVDRLLEIRNEKGLVPKPKYGLSAIQHLAEGRPEPLYDDVEIEMDHDARRLTRGRWNLRMIRSVVQSDFEGMSFTNSLLSQLLPLAPNADELVHLITQQIWNRTSRWELGGRTPEQVTTEHPDRVGKSREVFVTEWSHTGRNDPCPCGSGKKYKKCCLGKHRL